MNNLRVAFVSSCRSDYAKIRPYIRFFVARRIPVCLFLTSMHLNKDCAFTRQTFKKHFPKGVQFFWDEEFSPSSVMGMGHLLNTLPVFLRQNKINFLFVHGDRPEALAAALSAAFLRIPVCQIEAGDISGNIDESIRHAITKLAHRFLTDDELSRNLVLRLGENPSSVFVTGNLSLSMLPCAERQQEYLKKYALDSKPYVVVLYHPETGVLPRTQFKRAEELLEHLAPLAVEILLLPPNNDTGYEDIWRAFKQKEGKNIRCLPSLPSEEFLSVLNAAVCLVGNSSCGVKEAPLLGIPSVDIGERQQGRDTGREYPYLRKVKNAEQAAKWVKFFLENPPNRAKRTLSKNLFDKYLETILTPEFFKPQLQKKFYFSED